MRAPSRSQARRQRALVVSLLLVVVVAVGALGRDARRQVEPQARARSGRRAVGHLQARPQGVRLGPERDGQRAHQPRRRARACRGRRSAPRAATSSCRSRA